MRKSAPGLLYPGLDAVMGLVETASGPLHRQEMTMKSRMAGSPLFRGAAALWIELGVVALILLVQLLGLVGCRAKPTGPEPNDEQRRDGAQISLDALEEDYGVRLGLLAVTAGGGMVDLRLKILDAEKATLLLGDPAKPPTLVVEESGAAVQAPQGSSSADLALRDGGVLILLYPNAQGMIEPGTRVSLVFEDERLEPIESQ